MSEIIKWHKDMKPTDRYRVKTMSELTSLVNNNPNYNCYNQNIDKRCGFSIRLDGTAYYFASGMFEYCGREITCFETRTTPHTTLPNWFCKGMGFLWLLEWLVPIIDVITEDIDE